MSEFVSKDKIRPIRNTISLDEALAIITANAVPIDRKEDVSLFQANGRVLASEIIAKIDVPPFDRAAMDGFAVIAEDTTGANQQSPKKLRCLETVHSGDSPTKSVSRGTCTEIATGAPMPEGSNAVVMAEETHYGTNSDINILKSVLPLQHVGQCGADIKSGQSLLHPESVLTPSRLGSIAALGKATVKVFERPQIAILSTGNEIVEPGRSLGPGQIYDINQFTLSAIIGEHGGTPTSYSITTDTLNALEAIVESCLNNEPDILVFSGGSSVGKRDLTLDILEKFGEVLFHGISIKPGKPTLFGRIGKIPVFGMPGYPTSCLSNAYMLLVPLLRRIAHLPPYRTQTVLLPTAKRFVSTAGKHQFYTVRIVNGTAVPAFKASGDITSMSKADGYIEIPEKTTSIEKGQLVEVRLF